MSAPIQLIGETKVQPSPQNKKDGITSIVIDWKTGKMTEVYITDDAACQRYWDHTGLARPATYIVHDQRNCLRVCIECKLLMEASSNIPGHDERCTVKDCKDHSSPIHYTHPPGFYRYASQLMHDSKR